MDSKPLLTLAETCAFLAVREGTDDVRVSALIAMATADIERATGRFLTQQQNTEYLTTRDNRHTDYDLWGSSDYAVPAVAWGGMRTIVSPQTLPLEGVNVDPATLACWYAPQACGPDDYGDCNVLQPGRDFDLDTKDDRIILYRGTRFKLRALKATYTAGYPAAPTDGKPDEITLSASIPDWLKSAALIQCQFLKVKLRTDNIGMAAERTMVSGGSGKSASSRVSYAAFLRTNGLTDEAIGYVRHLRRVGIGRG